MSELERSLRHLAREVDWPPLPELDLRLERRRRPRRFALALALGAAAAAVGIAFAVPPARSAILRFFHLGGVTVERVQTLPAAQARPLTAALGRRVTPADAEFLLGQPFLLPPGAERAPLYEVPGSVSALLATPEPAVLTEFSFTGLLKKVAGASTAVQYVEVEPGVQGLWLSGAPHVLFTPSLPPRLARNVLIWERSDVTFRLEGASLTKDDALRLARAILGTAPR